MLGTTLVLIVVVTAGVAWCIKPKHVGTAFTATPPVLARVNSPSADATPEMRTVHLPTGDSYIIPPKSHGHFVMVYDWAVPVRIEDVAQVLTVPKLSTTDFASIPRVLHSLISPLNNTIYAAILHDYLYRNPADAVANKLDRETVDRLFYWAMRARGVFRLTAGLMYVGVRMGGSSSYMRKP